MVTLKLMHDPLKASSCTNRGRAVVARSCSLSRRHVHPWKDERSCQRWFTPVDLITALTLRLLYFHSFGTSAITVLDQPTRWGDHAPAVSPHWPGGLTEDLFDVPTFTTHLRNVFVHWTRRTKLDLLSLAFTQRSRMGFIERHNASKTVRLDEETSFFLALTKKISPDCAARLLHRKREFA